MGYNIPIKNNKINFDEFPCLMPRRTMCVHEHTRKQKEKKKVEELRANNETASFEDVI